MATFTSLGIGSGVDLNTMVTQLVALERAPLVQLSTAAKRLQTQVSSFGQIQSLFGTLQDASNKLTTASLWQQGVAKSADESAVGVSGGASAAAGNYAVTVQALASSQTLATGTTFASATALVGAGTLNITIGGWGAANPPTTFTAGTAAPVQVTLTAADTLQSLRDKINAADAGVTATLITDASGVRLSMRSADSGAANGFRITADPALANFAFDPQNGATGMQYKQASANARAVVNGISVESATNELNGVIEGLKLTLRKETATAVDVSVSRDTEAVTTAVKSFADAYNALAKYIGEQVKYEPTSKVGGPLQGDSAAANLQRQLRAILAQESGASAAFPRLSDIGLQAQRDGTLSVDAGQLSAAMVDLSELQKAFANNDTAVAANDGFARRYAELATQVLGVDGSITTRTQGLRKLISKNSDDQAKVESRAARVQARLVAQYTALDGNLSKLNALGSYVTQQLAAISNSSQSGR